MSDRLRIGLLQCGAIHPALVPRFGDYPDLFAALLAPHDVSLRTYDVVGGELPDDLGAVDGWLVSGSADSAYAPLPWIPPLEDLLRALVAAEAPLVAVCFGHQVLAQALGGRVAHADAGWGAGAHRYELVGPTRPWMRPEAGDGIRLIASHQDQVVQLPEGAELLARTAHCPVAAFTVGDHALAIQPHPEFTPGLSRALTGLRRDRIGDAAADAALASLDEPLDHGTVAAWMGAWWRR